jgi:alpha-1,3-mannosyltransferase
MGSVVEAIRFLGPNNCAVSIVEGRSSDSTYSILQKLKSEGEQLGSSFFLLQSDLDLKADGVDRIKALGELRNLALEPIVKHPSDFSASPIVVFINDIALCAEDILELLIQHTEQGASMTCGMDWIHDGEAIYDVWISRTINSGNTFFEVPQDADWKYKDNLFFDDPLTKQRFDALKPFEVYACWGGMVTLDARIFVAQRIKFRSSDSDECYMGEPTLLGKDLWKEGPGKIATIPVVNNGYSNDEGGKIKKRRGYVSKLVDVTQPFNSSELITWSKKPPPMVKCISMMWNDPHWVTPV